MDFYFDVVCPYAFLASTQVPALAAESGVEVRWRPVLLGGLQLEHGVAPDPNQVLSSARRTVGTRDLMRRADQMGLTVRFPHAHPRRTVDAMRLLLVAAPERVPALAEALFRAYWVDREDLADRAIVDRIGVAHGVPAGAIDDPAVKDQLRAETAAAAKLGVFGVPTFVVGGELHWGEDRLDFVREALGLGPPPPLPRVDGGEVRFFHDVASPFSYLASTRVEALGARVEWVPVLVGAMFKTIGTAMVPLHTFSDAKQAWVRQDLQRWAARLGVPFRFPTEFPLRSLVAQRVIVIEPTAAPAVYRAAWGEDRPISDPTVLADVLNRAGFDGEDLLVRADAPLIKDKLRRNTEQAVAVGACGVPTFLVDGKELFWGQDRLGQVAISLAEGLASAP